MSNSSHSPRRSTQLTQDASTALGIYPLATMLFPAELRDMVVDCLCDDVSSLRACSLTCKSWLPRARYHLFHRVQFTSGSRGHAFRALLDASPAITNYIREVEISGSGDASHIEPGRWPTLRARPDAHRPPAQTLATVDDPTVWLRRVLPQPSRKLLARVTRLKLTALPISGPLVDALDGHFTAVTTVVVDKCRSEAFEDLCSLARVIPRIECLRMDDAQWLRPTSPSETLGAKYSLGSLILSRKMDAGPVARWITAQAHATIASFTCYISSHSSAVAIGDLICKVGSSLRELGIGFSDVKDPTDLLRATSFSLKHATALRKLHIDCVNAFGCTSLPSLSWILQLLSRINSTHLTELSFNIPSSDVRILNLDGMAVVLSHTRCSSIQVVRFEVSARAGSIEDTKKQLLDGLSTLSDKGIDMQVHPSTRTS